VNALPPQTLRTLTPKSSAVRPMPATSQRTPAASKIDRDDRTAALWRRLFFIAMVVLPTVGSGVYFAFVASDRYYAEMLLVARQSVNPTTVQTSLVQSLSAALGPDLDATNAYMIANLITSQNMVRDLDQDGALRRMFSDQAADYLSSFDPKDSDYRLWRYWRRMVAVYIDPVAGLVTVRAQAFRKDDALWLANAIMRKTEQYVDEYDQRSRNDEMRFSEQDVARALEKDTEATAALRAFRDYFGKFNVSDEADADLTLLLAAWTQRIELEVERAISIRMSSASAPTLPTTDASIAALTKQIDELNERLTSTDAKARTTAAAIARFQWLEAERLYAEAIYTAARAAYEHARLEATRQQVYVMSYSPPHVPETAAYPRRVVNTALVFLCTFMLWGIAQLLGSTVADRRV
jgi:capsular polysaccharide transport system permease protein